MPATILLLDDEADFRALVRQPLVECGYQVIEAADCVTASALIEKYDFDVLIVDGYLPDQDGRDWIAVQRSRGNRVPIVFVTGTWNDFATYHRLVKELGVARVAYKPIIPLAFANMIEGLIASQSKVDDDSYADMDDGLGELRERYGRELPGKIAALSASIYALLRTPDDENAQKEAASQAHRLRGTAGSFGYCALGNACARLEDDLRMWMETRHHHDPLSTSRVAAHLEDVQRALSDEASLHAKPTHEPLNTLILVLVVDGRFQFREQMSSLGRAQGLRIIGAADAVQALHEYHLHPADAVVIDLHLGGGSGGVELARQLRTLSREIDLPLVLISDTTDMREKAVAIHLGASQLLGGLPTPEATVSATSAALSDHRLHQPKIVLVDDDADFSAVTCAILKEAGMNVTHVADPAMVPEVLARENAELLLLDVDLPIISGFDLCRALRSEPRWQELSILFLTARTDPASRIAAYEVGGDDYIPKPVVAIELRARIRARLERARLLRERGDRDAVTGLYLRRRFTDSISVGLRQCVRSHTPLTLVLMDLDAFKGINDSYGHLTGDAVLSRFGLLLASRFRPQDLRCRWGGDEFVVAFPSLDGKTAKVVIERALDEFTKVEFSAKNGQLFHSSFSGGVAVFPDDGQTQEELIQCADQRLYRAKAEGGSRIIYLD